ncbi:glycosyltransferase [Pseudomonas sp. NPDC096917]|uniref:glycosyltransferase n=1 Tax=Pseudomonas sp. NPDC096917 TaxID=3364483 RepID=UPI00383AB7AF
MKILYVITGLGVGGAERQVLDLADRFSSQGHEVKICYLTGPALLRPKSNDIELLPLNLKKTMPGFMVGIIKLRKIIKDFVPDVVHAHMVHANLFTRIVRPFCAIKKLINTAHNTNEGGRARMLAYRLTHSLADVTTNVTLEAVHVFEQKKACPVGTMQAIPNGIDTDIFKPDLLAREEIRTSEHVGEDEKLIVAVGRLVDAKDYGNLLSAFSELCQKRSNVKLWIVGDGPEREKLAGSVKLLGLSQYVRFLGVRSDVNKIYNAADLYTLSSAWEGFGLVVAEAMASEKVVVATDCGGVKEVLGGCGYLVSRKDPTALAQAMSAALDLSPEDSRKLSASARERIVENYSINEIVDVWARIYTS